MPRAPRNPHAGQVHPEEAEWGVGLAQHQCGQSGGRGGTEVGSGQGYGCVGCCWIRIRGQARAGEELGGFGGVEGDGGSDSEEK